MISIIICTINKDRLDRLEKSVRDTAVYDNEIIAYQNIYNYGLCKVYNECAVNAKNEFLCFVHEDVIFHSKEWDQKLIRHLQTERTGVVGVMGGRYKSLFGAGWRNGPTNTYRMNIKDGLEEGKVLLQNPNNVILDEVLCVDGAFLACNKQNWSKHPFDEDGFKGFHCYDTDLCMQMHDEGLKNYVAYDIMLEHFSQGSKNKDFINDFIAFQNKWKQALPDSIDNVTSKELTNFEGYALAETVALMKKEKCSNKERWKQVVAYRRQYKSLYHLLRSIYFGFIK